ncbi:very-long-chain (3R)-3-hydroxyacyl-CoA dehydratase 3 [Hyperolius riggenbachi]|uniref:very-long-chain (3R)-3-hydroxyacyl-CoA dehydratase 3 n=1 Tax=Hyperolius riggenbachi TaxID=752182 RepID=UPI0035A385BC
MSLSPQVYWAQRHHELYLRVELSDVQNPEIGITDNVLHFEALGHGAKGVNTYEFSLEFLEPVKDKVIQRSTQRHVNLIIKKKENRWWPRMTKQERKPLFLSPDFDRWIDESDAEMELREKEQERISRIRTESRVREDPFLYLKRGYLFMYNLVQFLGYSWIFVNMTVRLFILGKDSFYDTFHTMADMMYFCQMLAFLEILNPLIGVVKTGIMPALIQVFGRNFVLFIILGQVDDMQSKSVVFFVFYSWSIIEVIRYPFYMLACIDMEWKVLTWLRYTIWIPLYPLGGLAEATAVVLSMPIFNESGKFSLHLPSPLDVTITFSVFLSIYLIIFFLAITNNFRHLFKLRRRRLGTWKRKMA